MTFHHQPRPVVGSHSLQARWAPCPCVNASSGRARLEQHRLGQARRVRDRLGRLRGHLASLSGPSHERLPGSASVPPRWGHRTRVMTRRKSEHPADESPERWSPSSRRPEAAASGSPPSRSSPLGSSAVQVHTPCAAASARARWGGLDSLSGLPTGSAIGSVAPCGPGSPSSP